MNKPKAVFPKGPCDVCGAVEPLRPLKAKISWCSMEIEEDVCKDCARAFIKAHDQFVETRIKERRYQS